MQSQSEEQQAQVHQQVEQQRLEVRSARFDFFKKALQQDQLQLATVQQAPFKLQASNGGLKLFGENNKQFLVKMQ